MRGLVTSHVLPSASWPGSAQRSTFDHLRGIRVDHGEGITLLPVRGALPSGQYGSCWTERIEADRPFECETSPVDDDVVVIRAPESNGFVVVPRLHVESLEDLPLRCRASVL